MNLILSPQKISKCIQSKDLETVLQSLSQRDFSDNTFIALSNDLKDFLSWYESMNGESFEFQRVIPRDIIEYRTSCQNKELLPATINRRLTHLRIFFKTALKQKILQNDPTDGIRSIPQQSLSPKGLSSQESRKLIKEVELIGNIRDLCMIELMLSAGLRASEVVSIEKRHVDLSERKGTLLIQNTKGNKTRTVPLNNRLRSLVRQHLEFYENQIQKNEGFLFIGQRGILTVLATNKIVEKYSKKVGIPCSPHKLRHSFAYRYLQANPNDMVGLAQILGHSNINTTAIYTQHRIEDLQEAVERT